MKNGFMKKTQLTSAVLACLSGISAPAMADSFIEAMTHGSYTDSLRVRAEFVDQENFDDMAQALTVRGAYGYTTGSFNGFSLKTEAEVVMPLAGESYNSLANGNVNYPVVRDPTGGHFNKFALEYKGEGYTASAGRDEIIYDNWRWVGNVVWRQNHQTFNAAKIDGASGDFSYHVAAVYGVSNIDTYATPVQLADTYFLNLGYKTGLGSIAAYYYQDKPREGTEQVTSGASIKKDMESFKYYVELATQTEEFAAFDSSAMYGHLMASVKGGKNWFSIGYEYLGSDDGLDAVNSRYGTNHAFNGFADQFLGTPKGGLTDLYLTAAFPMEGQKFVATVHQFDSIEDTAAMEAGAYGTELDLVYIKPVTKQAKVLIKYANYMADDNAAGAQANDKQVLVAETTFSF